VTGVAVILPVLELLATNRTVYVPAIERVWVWRNPPVLKQLAELKVAPVGSKTETVRPQLGNVPPVKFTFALCPWLASKSSKPILPAVPIVTVVPDPEATRPVYTTSVAA